MLSIAGFDPSGGAGVLADAKTAEANGTVCCGVMSSLTYQNDAEFDDVEWVETEKIIRQIHVLRRRIGFTAVKIGLLADLSTLETIVFYLRDALGSIPIVWDPILKASAGFEFHDHQITSACCDVLRQITLLTPNMPEAESFFGTTTPIEIQEIINKNELCSVLLKGGHSDGAESTDFLISPMSISPIPGQKYPGFQKHGTGCILSSAIASGLAYQMTLEEACRYAKRYVAKAITSNIGLLSYHS